jgi:hypothetical protein
MTQVTTTLWLALAFVTMGATVNACNGGARAQTNQTTVVAVAYSQGSQEAAAHERKILAQVCVGEALWALRDCAAITHVLIKRWRTVPELQGMTLAEVAVAYSAPMRRKSRRARWVRALPASAGKHRVRWARVLNTVTGVLNGDVPDPCPLATHWGSPTDSPTDRMIGVCGRLGLKNIFYRVM